LIYAKGLTTYYESTGLSDKLGDGSSLNQCTNDISTTAILKPDGTMNLESCHYAFNFMRMLWRSITQVAFGYRDVISTGAATDLASDGTTPVPADLVYQRFVIAWYCNAKIENSNFVPTSSATENPLAKQSIGTSCVKVHKDTSSVPYSFTGF
jgi:hypothetical protein